MLARIGAPFDSDEHLFEIKWDGTRALCFVDRDGLRLRNRRGADLAVRYPEHIPWRALPAGTVLDGEIVVLAEGAPDFGSLLSREQARTADRAARLARSQPATYIVFDLLYRDFSPLLDRPLAERRERLESLLAERPLPSLVLSEGITGRGEAYFASAVERGLEGVIAKRLASRYLPGERTDAWQKFKRRLRLLGVVIGVSMRGEELRSLIIAADREGELRCVGRVGSGLTERDRAMLLARLPELERAAPVVPCRHRGRWIEPLLFCDVSYLEATRSGELRAPVFRGWVEPGGAP
jgi:DNA ligase D-like protein (predicted ligase)